MSEKLSGYDCYFLERDRFPFPGRVTVEITSRCNLNCTMCPRQHLRGTPSFREGDMDFTLWKKIIDEMGAHRPCTLVPFFRGEPLLHPQFLDMISYARARDISPVQLATNAMLLTGDISRSLIELELDFISISLDAGGRTSYERMRRGADLERVLENIESLLKAKDAAGAAKPVVQISAVETETNRGELKDFVRLWREKADRVRVYREHSRNGDFGRLDDRPRGPRQPCLKLLSDIVVYWDGKVGICNHDWSAGSALGDITVQSIAEVWTGDAYHRLRSDHAGGTIPETAVCANCDHWQAGYDEDGIIGELYD